MTIMPEAELGDCGNYVYAPAGKKNMLVASSWGGKEKPDQL